MNLVVSPGGNIGNGVGVGGVIVRRFKHFLRFLNVNLGHFTHGAAAIFDGLFFHPFALLGFIDIGVVKSRELVILFGL